MRTGKGTHTAFGDVVRIPHDVTGQAKVADLDQFALTDEHIPGCQISVDALGREEMGAETVAGNSEERLSVSGALGNMHRCSGVRGHQVCGHLPSSPARGLQYGAMYWEHPGWLGDPPPQDPTVLTVTTHTFLEARNSMPLATW